MATASVKAVATAVNRAETLYVLGILLLYHRIWEELLKISRSTCIYFKVLEEP